MQKERAKLTFNRKNLHSLLLINCKRIRVRIPAAGLIRGLSFAWALSYGSLLPCQGSPPDDRYFDVPVERHPFDEQQRDKLTHDLDYSVAPADRDSSRLTRSTPPIQDNQAISGRLQEGFKWVVIALSLVILLWLIWAILRASGLFTPGFKKLARSETAPLADDIVDRLDETDLDAGIREALQRGQYNLAIRLYYLSILKALSQRQMIHWKKDKTNRAYLQEMRDHPLYSDFREITLLFETAWYGDRPVREADFIPARHRFESLRSAIEQP